MPDNEDYPQGVVDIRPADREDLEGHQLLNEREAEALDVVRSRAEKWSEITTSLTGLFGIGSVLTSVESLPNIETYWRIAIAVLLGAGLTCLARSAYLLFPTMGLLRNVNELSEVRHLLDRDRANRALEEMKRLRRSIRCTFLGLLFISVAMGLSWFAPRNPTSGES